MELPKNITQIGEANHRCKIYVEDYVVSYMKQLNRVARDKDIAVALYGVRKEEDDVSYVFLYGACKLAFLQRETRHLSQAQMQEIEREGRKYFGEYVFLGYRLLDGEMIEGFHICEQGICRYISGYAQFYEKNDSMLAYMLDVREDVQPEVVDRQKYEAVKKKQEERRDKYEGKEFSKEKYPKAEPKENQSNLRGMKVAVVAGFALLCLIGLTSMNGSGDTESIQVMARQVMNDIMEQRLPEWEEETVTEEIAGTEVSQEAQVDTLVAEDKLAEAILQENEAAVSTDQITVTESAENPTENTEILSEAEPVTESVSTSEPEIGSEQAEEVAAVEEIQKPQSTSYTIREGDTLIGISVRNYGSDARVSEICALNQIENPDDIKVGQKILLP